MRHDGAIHVRARRGLGQLAGRGRGGRRVIALDGRKVGVDDAAGGTGAGDVHEQMHPAIALVQRPQIERVGGQVLHVGRAGRHIDGTARGTACRRRVRRARLAKEAHHGHVVIQKLPLPAQAPMTQGVHEGRKVGALLQLVVEPDAAGVRNPEVGPAIDPADPAARLRGVAAQGLRLADSRAHNVLGANARLFGHRLPLSPGVAPGYIRP